MHGDLYFVLLFVVWRLLKKSLHTNTNYHIIYLIIFLINIGIGALNEVVEFIALLVFPQTGVCGYFNTGWDTVFKGLGSLLGMIVLYLIKEK